MTTIPTSSLAAVSGGLSKTAITALEHASEKFGVFQGLLAHANGELTRQRLLRESDKAFAHIGKFSSYLAKRVH